MMTIEELKAENCKECSLYVKGECNENCLQFARLKRLEYVEQHPEINRKNLLNYLRSLIRCTETDSDCSYNKAIYEIIDKIEIPGDEYVFCNECDDCDTCSDTSGRDGCEFGTRRTWE